MGKTSSGERRRGCWRSCWKRCANFEFRISDFELNSNSQFEISNLLVLPVRLFSRLDADRQFVLSGREGTRRIGSEHAGRVVGTVEVEDRLASDRRLRVEEAAAAIGLVAIGLIAEDHEEVRLAGL